MARTIIEIELMAIGPYIIIIEQLKMSCYYRSWKEAAKVRRRGKWRYFSALWFPSKFTTFHLTFDLFYLFLSFRTSGKLLHISCIGILCVERV